VNADTAPRADVRWYDVPDPGEAAASVVDAFGTAFGYVPSGVWASPGRVNLIGEHVDYNAGLCLPFALPHRTFVAVATRDDDRVRVRSCQADDGFDGLLDDVVPPGSGPSEVRGWSGYAVGVPWALRQAGFTVPGADIMVDGHVPLGSGLSSSAALECAVALAVDELAGLGLGADDAGRARLAAACVQAETRIAGAPTGGMDQAASLRCAEGQAILLDCRDSSVTHVDFDLDSAGLVMLVIDTRASHALVDGRYGSRRQECEEAARILEVPALRDIGASALEDVLSRLPDTQLRRRVRHVVTEIDRVRQTVTLLQAQRPVDIGALLDASHLSLRDDYEVSCRELDLAVEAARGAGAIGARMTGGGFGGSAIALCHQDQLDAVARQVAAAFESEGLAPPAFLQAEPSAAGSRVA
jgi:galactokinase